MLQCVRTGEGFCGLHVAHVRIICPVRDVTHVRKCTRPSPTFPYCKRQKAGQGPGNEARGGALHVQRGCTSCREGVYFTSRGDTIRVKRGYYLRREGCALRRERGALHVERGHGNIIACDFACTCNMGVLNRLYARLNGMQLTSNAEID